MTVGSDVGFDRWTARRRILVVDDDPAVRETLALALGCQGYDVLTADSGGAALDIVRACEVDLVLTDLRMRGMDGIATLRELRALKPKARAMVITGYASEEAMNELSERGVAVFIKPFTLQDLYAAVRRALES